MCCRRGCAGVGARHCPFGLHALRGAACGGHWGRPSRGGLPSTVERGLWCQALSLPQPPVPLGRVARVPRLVFPGVQLVWAWGPSTVPLACMPCGRLRAAGLMGGCPGGMAFNRCEGRLVSGAVPPPAARPFGAGSQGSATRVSRGAVGVGVGAQHCPFGLHALREAACRGIDGRMSRGDGLQPL